MQTLIFIDRILDTNGLDN